MIHRLRLMMGATALLYFGPLLAGLGGHGWAVVPVFAAIFMLWLVIMRPQDFPRNLSDWQRPEALIAFAARGAVQLLLVLVCFGIGRGIGGVLGSLPPFPLMLPIGISFLAIPLARLIWDPRKAQDMDAVLTDALAQIETGTAVGSDFSYAKAVLAPLNGLPDDVTEAELESHLDAIRALVDEAMTFEVLLEQVNSGEASLPSQRALMLLASDGAALERMADLRDAPVKALQALRQDAALVARMAQRLVTALRQDPDVWPDCPTPGFLEELRADLPAAADNLSALEAEVIAQGPAD
ncbi:hypothetical protein EGN72_11375 [Pseudorhodobacter sp. E13]|uniref:hypothetical protein n=1 Tax=Pseudorhodobacter sp. E13 TaxID=2487931 RepID=UPI000F8F5017|nr:hypothetical protein [Pseudorhodobacter sp. E13]RUS59897.1 hypothetical protein EGN72_11375 [Pseudorhodobacter sp. E13]